MDNKINEMDEELDLIYDQIQLLQLEAMEIHKKIRRLLKNEG